MTQSIQYVSGYWCLPGNGKNKPEYYQRSLEALVRRLCGKKLLFFAGDDEIVALVDDACSAFGVDVEIRLLPLEALPQHVLAERLTTSCRRMELDCWSMDRKFYSEKGVVHYWRDLKGSGEEVYSHLLAIWLSKISLVAGFANSVDASTPLAWVDSSLVRIKGNRSNWCFWKQSVEPGRVCHYASPMRYLGGCLPVSAGFLLAQAADWYRLESLFNDVASQSVVMSYGHDEETILGECWRRRPELFHCIGRPYSRMSFHATVRARLRDIWMDLLSTC